ncbi:hypothetical protein [Mucisphaera sp.]|uniref:hypothetical protein n=1 Tax=Mucisphaera sp. TaxID=2913024 RepID=UPI003D0BDE8B
MNLLMASRSSIGLDLGSRRIKAAQFARTRSGLSLAAWLDIARPETSIDQAWAVRLHGLLARAGFSGKQLCLAAPSREVQASVISLPPAEDADSLEQVARMSLARMHRLEPDAFEFSAWPLASEGGGRGKQQVMSYAYEHASAISLMDTFEGAGFDVERIDLPSLAILAAFGDQIDDTDRLGLTVDMGWSGCRIIAHRHGTIVYERAIETAGLSALYEAVAGVTEFDSDLVHAQIVRCDQPSRKAQADHTVVKAIRQHAGLLTEEIGVCKNYLDRQYRGDRDAVVNLVGGGASLILLLETLGQQLGLEVQAPVLPGLPAGRTREMLDAITLARGLALRGWQAQGVAV